MSAFEIGVSALRSMQRALDTTGHNIANVNTEGYSRQRVELTQETPQNLSNGFMGKGVKVLDVKRIADDFLIGQARTTSSNSSNVDTLHELASQVDSILGEPDSGVATAINDFFKSVQTVAANPSSLSAREVMLSEGGTVAERFNALDSRLDSVETLTNKKIEQSVAEINDIAKHIAELNESIVIAQGQAAGKIPNDMVDQRDTWVDKLAQKIAVQVIKQDDGSANVMIGNGQSLVIANGSRKLATVPNQYDASRLEITYDNAGQTMLITEALKGGELGGTLRFRDEVLLPARDQVGRLGITFAHTLNGQHRSGMDLNGAMGQDMFATEVPYQIPKGGTVGKLDIVFDDATINDLSADRYRLSYDGTNYVLRNESKNTQQTLGPAGSGPFTVAGIKISETVPPNAGDAWAIQPVRFGAKDIKVTLGDARAIAAASPLMAAADEANVSDAKVGTLKVTDPNNPALTSAATIVFDNPPTTYTVDGNGPIAYSNTGSIDYNGWSLKLSGTVKAGDKFTVGANAGGVGDNTNAKSLANLQKQRILEGGTSTYEDNYAGLVGNVGVQTRQAGLAAKAAGALFKDAEEARQAVSGVNLDEEAANLLKFQQGYQAAARIIAAAGEMFQSLIRAAGG